MHQSSSFEPLFTETRESFNRHQGISTKYDKLSRRILASIEPGLSSRNIYPAQENWALLLVTPNGSVSAATTALDIATPILVEGLGDLNIAEDAALRLADASRLLPGSKPANRSTVQQVHGRSLSEMFAEESMTSHIKTDSLTALHWHKALNYLQAHYPLTVLTGDDTRVLGPLTQKLDTRRLQLEEECLQLELELADLEGSYATMKADLTTAAGSLDKLRTKLWYSRFVLSSDAYDNARNITVALNNMAIPTLQGVALSHDQLVQSEPSRPGTSATSASSVFDQPRVDTETIMKAPADHGGPRKLSDVQIENTRKWLERNHVENFCRGEERIHRFCMEVRLVIKQLVGDTIAESPVLWSSELFAREKSLYDIHAGALFGGASPSRAASVMSEPLTSTYHPLRAALAGSKASTFGGSSRFGRDGMGSDISSYISSPGRATTSTTLESSFWSPAPSNSRSVTSASMLSRPASTFEGHALLRTMDRSQEKATFLDGLRQDLNSLLLSDLACPVWSCGSESDAWMDEICRTPNILERLHQRSAMSRLRPSPDRTVANIGSGSKGPIRRQHRSQSAAPPQASLHTKGLDTRFHLVESALLNDGGGFRGNRFPFLSAFNDILCRVKDHTDPVLKLKAIHDFKTLSQDFHMRLQNSSLNTDLALAAGHDGTDDATRRRSLDPSVLTANLRRRRHEKMSTLVPDHADSEEYVIVQSLKDLLLVLRPKTMFRDLQYIATFVSSDKLDDAELGQAFLHVGLAALAWKDEICRGMVDVADRIVSKDSIKRNVSGATLKEPSVLKAMEYWIIGAREGNAIAQRELASLYLTHPDVPPIISMPLVSSSDIFKSEMMWEGEGDFRRSSQALCLALHWMQEAARNGDAVARTKLREREAGRSVR